MNNEEKILNILEKMDARLSKLEQGQAKLEQAQAKMQEDMEMIKEDVAITRTATNTLLDWAEKAEVQIRIPLYNKTE